MPTEKQSAASRANSQHSTGPRSAEGKAKSRFNALKHGIFAESHIIFDESAEALDDLAAEYRERFNPADAAERCLVDVLIDSEWRLRRLRRVETQTWTKMNRELIDHRRSFAKQLGEVVAPTAGEVFSADMDKLTVIQRAIGACQRDYRQTLKELRIRATGIPACRPTTEIPAPEPEQTAPVAQALPPDSATGNPACRPPAPEPEQTKTTSESSASFPNNVQTTPEPPLADPLADPETPAIPAVVAGPARPFVAPAQPLTADQLSTLPEAA